MFLLVYNMILIGLHSRRTKAFTRNIVFILKYFIHKYENKIFNF